MILYGIVLIINEFRQQKGNESVDVEEKTENEWNDKRVLSK